MSEVTLVAIEIVVDLSPAYYIVCQVGPYALIFSQLPSVLKSITFFEQSANL